MSGSTYCVRCSRQLQVQSPCGLCVTCLAEMNPLQETIQDIRSFDEINLRASTVVGDSAHPAVDRTPSLALKVDTLTVVPLAERVSFPPAPAGYDLLKVLGQGGMGVVYLARDQITEQLVAMKFLQRIGSPEAYSRFVVELRALASLNHPNIVRVLGHDFLRANPYFITEYAAGGSVAKKLEALTAFEPVAAARLMATVARAVHVANQAQVIHRDLKPSNILLAEDGTPQISDFGLAKRLDRDDQLTTGYGAIGTPAYMAPEQARPVLGAVTARTDVYGLGATLYHLVTGRPPFSGDHAEVITQVLNKLPRPPRLLRPSIPVELEAIILKCLEKQPARRYHSAEHLAEDLDRFLAGARPEAPVLSWRRRLVRWGQRHRSGVAVVVALVLLATTAAAVWQTTRQTTRQVDPQDQLRTDLKAGRVAHILFESGVPEWLKDNWLIHPAPLGQSVAANGACAYESIQPSLLAFLKDPGIDHYRVTAELRVMRSALVTDPTQPTSLREFLRSDVGLFVGHVVGNGNDGAEAHGFLVIEFTDYLPSSVIELGITEATVQPCGRLILTQPNAPVAHPRYGCYKTTRFPPTRKLPGEWRVIRVEVRPEGMKFFWAEEPGQPFQLLADASAQSISNCYANLQNLLDQHRGKSDIKLPPWSPRTPFGIWSQSSAVAVRNVVVESLPDPN